MKMQKFNTLSNNDHMDGYFYKIRHLVENAFPWLKQFRGMSTRYDKLKKNYENSVALLASLFGYHYEMSTDPTLIFKAYFFDGTQ